MFLADGINACVVGRRKYHEPLKNKCAVNVVIINYNAGNIRSVDYALQRMGIKAVVTGDPEKIQKADKVIFPGVGEAKTTMQYLCKHGLDALVKELKQPVLGICLGLQLMCSHTEEGDVPCLGIFNERIRRFDNMGRSEYKIPEMGWNTLNQVQSDLFNREEEGQYVYFVHSYYAEIGEHTAARTSYVQDFSSALQKDNFYATQFHPEKSGPVGERILQNFIAL